MSLTQNDKYVALKAQVPDFTTDVTSIDSINYSFATWNVSTESPQRVQFPWYPEIPYPKSTVALDENGIPIVENGELKMNPPPVEDPPIYRTLQEAWNHVIDVSYDMVFPPT